MFQLRDSLVLLILVTFRELWYEWAEAGDWR